MAPPMVPSFFQIGYPVTIQLADGSLFTHALTHRGYRGSVPAAGDW